MALTKLNARSGLTTGKILQVVSAENTQERSTTSTSFSEVVSVSITPSATSSKILIIASLSNCRRDSTNGFVQMRVTDGASFNKKVSHATLYNDSTGALRLASVSGNFLHSANTTSAKTYTLQFCTGNGAQVTVGDNGDTTSSITVMELASATITDDTVYRGT